MSVSISTGLASSGLVFSIDTANTQKSYKGGPVTNVQWNSGTELTPWGYPNATIDDVSNTPEAGPVVGAKTWRFTHSGVNASGFTSQWTGWETGLGAVTGVANDVWTLSYWYRTTSPGDATTFATLEGVYVNDWSRQYSSTELSGVRSIIADGKWHYNSVTRRMDEAYTSAIIVDGPSWNTANAGIVYFNGLQWNKNAYPAQFAQGTRANTGVFFDVTGNSTITANSLTYDYTGAPSFNGSSDYMTLGGSLLSPSVVSIEAWYKHTNSGQTTSFIGGFGNTGAFGYWLGRDNGNLMFSAGDGTTSLRPVVTQGVNTMYHAVGTYDGTNARLYVNGVLVSTVSTGVGVLNYTGVTTGYIGQLTGLTGTRYWTGQIPVVRIYNRALTAAEVMQNFLAQRVRFGV
jgi:hypothetical protein